VTHSEYAVRSQHDLGTATCWRDVTDALPTQKMRDQSPYPSAPQQCSLACISSMTSRRVASPPYRLSDTDNMFCAHSSIGVDIVAPPRSLLTSCVLDTALLEWMNEHAVRTYTAPDSAALYLNYVRIA